MRPPAKIKPWLSDQEMLTWIEESDNEDSRNRRRAIGLTHIDKLHARKVAQILEVSIQSVWLWIKQYNELGPKGLERKGRGGRRWGFLSQEEELKFLEPVIKQARLNNHPDIIHIKSLIEKKLGKKVSKAYVYGLLRRHQISRIIAQSNISRPIPSGNDSFKKLSQPWRNRKG